MLKRNQMIDDLRAGISVALVALPLSIGIAIASGAPASSGIIAAIIGGIIGSWLGSGNININGPAAGLIVIILDVILDLGGGDNVKGFKFALAAFILAGAFQILFGFFKLGKRGLFVPVAIIRGMLAAIAVIIVGKQVHLLFGHAPHSKSPLMIYAELPNAVANMNIDIFIVGSVSLIFYFAWVKLPWKWTKYFSPKLITIIFGSFCAAYLQLEQSALLSVPSNIQDWIIFPDFSILKTYEGIKASVTIALVASMESVLSATEIDKLDEQHRTTDTDRDLISKGACNMLSGAIGGLPIIAEVFRSSANVSFGAKTWRANFFHGFFVLAGCILFPDILKKIPIAALAAIVITAGTKLGRGVSVLNPKKIGLDNMLGFLVTFIVTLATDLLMGISIGVIALFIVKVSLGLDLRNAFKASYTKRSSTSETIFIFTSALAFTNFLSVRNDINEQLIHGKNVVLDFTDCNYVDHAVLDEINDLEENFGKQSLSLIIANSSNPHL